VREAITDDAVRTLPIVGSVDQWVDSTNALGNLDELRRIVAVTLKLGGGKRPRMKVPEGGVGGVLGPAGSDRRAVVADLRL
jgi:hypothetical protein